MSTNYSLTGLNFESNDQSVFGTGKAFVIEERFPKVIAQWDDGFNIDAYLDSFEITPAIRVKNPFTGRTLFTIPAVEIPIKSGIDWELNTDGLIEFEALFNLTAGDIDSQLDYDLSLDFVDQFRVAPNTSFTLASNGTSTLTDGSFATTSPSLKAAAQFNYEVNFESQLDAELFGIDIIPSALEPVIGDVDFGFDGTYTLAEADLNGVRLIQVPTIQIPTFEGQPPSKAFLFDLDLLDEKISIKVDPFTGKFDIGIDNGTKIVEGIGKRSKSDPPNLNPSKPPFTYDLGDLSFSFPRVETQGTLNDAGTQISGSGSKKFADLNLDIDGGLSLAATQATGLPLTTGFKFDAKKALEISADLIDINVGPTLSLGQEYDLTPGDFKTIFKFTDIVTGAPKSVLIDGELKTEHPANSFDEIPNLILTEPVKVTPTFQPTAQLTTDNTIDLGFEATFDFLKLGYKLKIPSGAAKGLTIATGQLGPVLTATITEATFGADPLSFSIQDLIQAIIRDDGSDTFGLEGWNSFTGSDIILDVSDSGNNAGFSGIDDGVNDQAPVANDDGSVATTDEDTTTTFNAAILLDNDFDPDAFDTLSITDVTATAGIATLNTDGTVTYSPNESFESLAVGFSDADTLTYTIVDAFNREATATATVTITGVNDDPVASPDATRISGNFSEPSFLAEGLPLQGSIAVLENDTDIDTDDTPDTLSLDGQGQILITDLGSEVTVSGSQVTNYGNQGNGLGFSADQADEVGEVLFDRVEYTLSDGNGGTDTGEAYFVIFGNDNDIATNQQL